MDLWLWRDPSGPKATLGQMFVNGIFECDTLEDVVRPKGVKVPGQTAIPFGRYKVIIDQSQRFGRLMPHVLDVPMFLGIRIHWGGTDKDTEGCIILGKRVAGNDDLVVGSHIAFDAFFTQLKGALDAGEEVWLTITSEADVLAEAA